MKRIIADRCSIVGCKRDGVLNSNGKQYFSKGYCNHHYYKLKTYKDPLAEGRLLHGLSNSPTYNSYCSMMQRCSYKPHNRYPVYGGRGIKVCKEWASEHGFFKFLEDMGERPGGTSLDRINNDGDYEPDNCRWATVKQQSSNKSNTIHVLLDGIDTCLSQACREVGLLPATGWLRYKEGRKIHPRIELKDLPEA